MVLDIDDCELVFGAGRERGEKEKGGIFVGMFEPRNFQLFLKLFQGIFDAIAVACLSATARSKLTFQKIWKFLSSRSLSWSQSFSTELQMLIYVKI